MTYTTKTKPLRCRLRQHKWVLRMNDEGGRFHECQFCGKFDDSTAGGTGPGMFGAG